MSSQVNVQDLQALHDQLESILAQAKSETSEVEQAEKQVSKVRKALATTGRKYGKASWEVFADSVQNTVSDSLKEVIKLVIAIAVGKFLGNSAGDWAVLAIFLVTWIIITVGKAARKGND